MVQIPDTVLAVLTETGATLSLDFEQGLTLTGRQLVGDSSSSVYWACAMNKIQSPVYLLS